METVEEKSRSKIRSYWCGHCREFVSKTIYYQNKRRYYSTDTLTWSHENDEGSSNYQTETIEDFVISDEGEHS